MNAPSPENFNAVFRQSFLFSCLDAEEFALLGSLAHRRCAEDRQVIFHKGATGGNMFAVVRGAVKISTYSESGKEITLGILAPGEFFGEIALFDGDTRTATAAALGPTELWVLERATVLSFLEQRPQVAIHMLAAMARRLRMADAAIEDSNFLGLPARLAKKILALADMFGHEGLKGVRINLKLSQQELANMVGATRESVNKVVGPWIDEGIISLQRGYLIIRDRDALARIVSG